MAAYFFIYAEAVAASVALRHISKFHGSLLYLDLVNKFLPGVLVTVWAHEHVQGGIIKEAGLNQLRSS